MDDRMVASNLVTKPDVKENNIKINNRKGEFFILFVSL